MSELGNRVRAARAYAGDMTQKELAARLPFSESTLQRTEAGGKALNDLEEPGFVKAVSDATGLPPWFFIDDFEQVSGRTDSDTGDALGRVERQLQKLQSQLRDFERETHKEMEKSARGLASGRGRLGRIEKNLAALGEVLLEPGDET